MSRCPQKSRRPKSLSKKQGRILFAFIKDKAAINFRAWLSWGNLIAISLIALFIYLLLPYRVISQPPGLLVKTEPQQTLLTKPLPPIVIDGAIITPLATYDITARVLARYTYRNGRLGRLSPLDLSLGWQELSDSAVLEHTKIVPMTRYSILEFDQPLPIKNPETLFANTHLIPSNGSIKSDLMSLRVGHIVRLKGYLVSVTWPDGFTWSSSLSRDDNGEGACEIMLVLEAERL